MNKILLKLPRVYAAFQELAAETEAENLKSYRFEIKPFRGVVRITHVRTGAFREVSLWS